MPAPGRGERGGESEEVGEKGTLDGGNCVLRLGKHSLASGTGVTWLGWSPAGWRGSSEQQYVGRYVKASLWQASRARQGTWGWHGGKGEVP